jgi:hypothetical protein
LIAQVVSEMLRILKHDRSLMAHAMKVFVFAGVIGDLEGLTGDRRRSLRAAAALHDIVLPECLDREGEWNSELQQRYGEPMVREVLQRLGYDRYAERVAFLVGHSHNFMHEMDDHLDLQILIEAIFLADLSEGRCEEKPEDVCSRYFATHAGRALIKDLFFSDEYVRGAK